MNFTFETFQQFPGGSHFVVVCSPHYTSVVLPKWRTPILGVRKTQRCLLFVHAFGIQNTRTVCVTACRRLASCNSFSFLPQIPTVLSQRNPSRRRQVMTSGKARMRMKTSKLVTQLTAWTEHRFSHTLHIVFPLIHLTAGKVKQPLSVDRFFLKLASKPSR